MIRTKDALPEPEHREPTFAMAIEMTLTAAEKFSPQNTFVPWAALTALYEDMLRVRNEHNAYIRAKCGTIK
jgi:hypothetical protein